MRLAEVKTAIEREDEPAPLYSDLQPQARSGKINPRGMVDVDAIIRQTLKEAV